MAEYIAPNEWKHARERLDLLEAISDPATTRCLDLLGVSPGWHCLEVAGGGGSIAAWLCERVGPTGHVLATDLNTLFLETITASNLEVRRHDFLVEPLPEAAFDLVHTRTFLTHLPNPEEALLKLAAAVKPGGWLLVEENTFSTAMPDPSMKPVALALSQKAWAAILSALESNGVDTQIGRRLYHAVVTTGLRQVSATGTALMLHGGSVGARFWQVTLEQLRELVLRAGQVSEQELQDFHELLGSPEYRWLSPLMMSVWGQRQDS